MKHLLKIKNLLAVIFLITLIITPFITIDRGTLNSLYFVSGFLFLLIFFTTKNESNSFLIYLFNEKEKTISNQYKHIKFLTKEVIRNQKENDQLKNTEIKFLREELNRMSEENAKFRNMTTEEFENETVVRICYEHLDSFTDIYPDEKSEDGLYLENKIPDKVKLTVYCNGTNEDGFLVNKTSDDLGLQALIAKKWIIHSELEKLAGRSLS